MNPSPNRFSLSSLFTIRLVCIFPSIIQLFRREKLPADRIPFPDLEIFFDFPKNLLEGFLFVFDTSYSVEIKKKKKREKINHMSSLTLPASRHERFCFFSFGERTEKTTQKRTETHSVTVLYLSGILCSLLCAIPHRNPSIIIKDSCLNDSSQFAENLPPSPSATAVSTSDRSR